MRLPLLRIVAVLWFIWGLVHILAGVMTLTQSTAGAVQGIADAVDPSTLDVTYPAATGAVIKQHGFNLLWIGAVTTLCAPWIWRRRFPAVALAALVGGLADVGYFVFMDLGGYVKFMPGTLMTLVSGSAILLSWIAWRAEAGKPTAT
ncbi:MAG: hypothetical protein AAGN66_03120 [Acidobacteriota bacterium]